ncbi:MAG: GerAB/ArcD/ProY family transporter [Bacillota bacterium]
MKSDRPERLGLSQTQVAALTITCMLAMGVFSFPRDTIEAGERSALYGILVSWLFAFAGAGLIGVVAAKFPGMSAVGVFRRVLGRWVWVVLVLPIAFEVVYLGMVTRNFTDLMKEVFYTDTPEGVLILIMLAVAVYQAQKGLGPLSRSVQFTLAIVLVILLGGYLASLSKVDFSFLTPQRPVLLDTVRAGYRSMDSWLGYPVLLMVLGYAKDRRSIRNGVVIGFVVTGLLMLLIFIDALGLFGYVGVRRIIWPTVSVLRLLRVHGFLIERLGLFVLSGWTVLVLNSLSLHLWAVGQAVRDLLGADGARLWSLVAMIPAVIAVSRIPTNLAQFFEWAPYIIAFGAIEGWVLSLLVLAVARLRGVRGDPWENP